MNHRIEDYDNMETIKCPVCGREVQKGTHFCGWCGHVLANECSEDKREWPEEERSVSFTIYEAPKGVTIGEEPESSDSYSYDYAEGWDETSDESNVPKSSDGWSKGYVLLSLVIILLIGITIGAASLIPDHDESLASRMPDYEKVVQRRQIQDERREMRLEQQREEVRRHEEEVRRMEEQEKAEALEAKRLREEEQALQEGVMNETELDARIEELLRGM